MSAYLRYVDDFLLFASEKKQQLWDWRSAVIERLGRLRLSLHEQQAQIYPCSTGLLSLGFRSYPDHRRVKRRKVVEYRRKLRGLLEQAGKDAQGLERLDASVQGWVNHVRYANSWGLRRSMLDFTIPRM